MGGRNPITNWLALKDNCGASKSRTLISPSPPPPGGDTYWACLSHSRHLIVASIITASTSWNRCFVSTGLRRWKRGTCRRRQVVKTWRSIVHCEVVPQQCRSMFWRIVGLQNHLLVLATLRSAFLQAFCWESQINNLFLPSPVIMLLREL